MPFSVDGPVNLMRGLRDVMAHEDNAQTRLNTIVELIANNMGVGVCSVYFRQADDVLELYATHGLNQDAVHHTKLRMGEGLVGDIAQHRRLLNLSDATRHPRFAYRPETGEDPFRSFVGIPILRSGEILGVLVVQDREERFFIAPEVEALQTVAMVLSEILQTQGMDKTYAEGTAYSFAGQKLSEGLALGHVVRHEPRVEIHQLIADDAEAEIMRLNAAIYKLRENIDELLVTEDVSHAGDHFDVLQTYRMFANDMGWLRRLYTAINTGLTAEAAVERVNYDMRARLVGQRDQYLRDRIHDFDDLSNRLLRVLTGAAQLASEEKLPRDAILVARTMGPSELLDYDRRRLRGVVLEEGGAGAHVVIVARALNIPVLGGVQHVVDIARDGEEIIIDAREGMVHLNPPPDLVESCSDRAQFFARQQRRYRHYRNRPAVTRDGHSVELNINAGLLVDVENLKNSGADHIGLFRTELQFMISARLPRRDEQRQFYKNVLDLADGREVTFRTLDIGGDKMLPFMQARQEDNPALGWRAIRMVLDREKLLRYQLRALLQAAQGQKLKLMFPFISTVDEFRRAKAVLQKEIEHQQRFGHELPLKIEVGTMLEVPSLLWSLDELLPLVDFLSVGTNDLMQYIFASDRGNPKTSQRYDILSAPFLRLMRDIAQACQKHQTPVSLCGEAVGEPVVAMTMMGLGFTRFSIPASSIGPVKYMINNIRDYDRLSLAVHHIIDNAQDNLRENLRDLQMTDIFTRTRTSVMGENKKQIEK